MAATNSTPRNCPNCGVMLSGAYEEAHHIHWHRKIDAIDDAIERDEEPDCEDSDLGNLPLDTRPLLAETPEEAYRLAIGGRQIRSLKETKVFDSERLQNSPLFDRRLF